MDTFAEFVRERYNFEDERQKTLNNRVGLPIGVLTLVFAVVTYYVRNLRVLGRDAWSVTFCIAFVAMLVSILFSIYFLIRSFHNYAYGYPPMPSDVLRDIDNIKAYYEDEYFKDVGSRQKQKLIEADVNSLITGYCRECLEVNIPNNNRKSKYLHSCSSALVAVLVLLFLSSIPFCVRYHSNPRVCKTETMKPQEEARTMPDKQKQDSKPPQAPPAKPKPTSIQLIKEHKEKPEQQGTKK